MEEEEQMQQKAIYRLLKEVRGCAGCGLLCFATLCLCFAETSVGVHVSTACMPVLPPQAQRTYKGDSISAATDFYTVHVPHRTD